MKKFLKLTTLVVSMVMALTFVSCANGNTSNNGNENSNENTSNNGNENSNENTSNNGNENSNGNTSNNGNENSNGNTSNNGNENSNEEELNLVGTYGISKIENLIKNSKSEQAYTTTMPTSSSLRQYGTIKTIEGDTTSVAEIDLTITKTADGYSFNWAKCNIDGVAASEEAKAEMVKDVSDKYWNIYTEMFAMTITTTADGKWSDNSSPASSGTYTVDKANSKVTMISNGETLQEPVIMEATYSNNGKILVVVQDDSDEKVTDKYAMTFTRK